MIDPTPTFEDQDQIFEHFLNFYHAPTFKLKCGFEYQDTFYFLFIFLELAFWWLTLTPLPKGKGTLKNRAQ